MSYPLVLLYHVEQLLTIRLDPQRAARRGVLPYRFHAFLGVPYGDGQHPPRLGVLDVVATDEARLILDPRAETPGLLRSYAARGLFV